MTGLPISRKPRILVFPSSTEIGLEIAAALSSAKGVTLFGANQPGHAHGPYAFRRHFTLPTVDAEGWRDELHRLVLDQGIDAIFAAHDDALVALADAGDVGATALGSPPDTCRLLRFKSKTYEALSGHVRIPKVLAKTSEPETLPLFAKPDRGQGSKGARRIDTRDELETLRRAVEDHVITEYLPGREYTVDCFTDRHGTLLFAGGRERLRVRNGIAVSTRPVERPEFGRIAAAVNSRIRFRGAWFFQVKEASDGDLAILEAAPRIAGAMAMHRAMGVNLALLTVLDAQKVDLEIPSPQYVVHMDRALSNRFISGTAERISKLYIDWDDTMVVDGRVHPPALQLVYQCLDDGIPVALVTRHAGDIATSLAKAHLSSAFSEVHHLQAGQSKAEVMSPDPRALFVDDSFSERQDVARRTGMMCIDPSAIEAFLDFRR